MEMNEMKEWNIEETKMEDIDNCYEDMAFGIEICGCMRRMVKMVNGEW